MERHEHFSFAIEEMATQFRQLLARLGEARHRPGPDQQGDVTLAAEQEGQQLAPDEPRGTRDEYGRHGVGGSDPIHVI